MNKPRPQSPSAPPQRTTAGGAHTNAAEITHVKRLLAPSAARKRQIVLLQGLLSLAAQQRVLVQAEDVSQLPQLMGERQMLIDELLALDAMCIAQAKPQAGTDVAHLEAKVRELASTLHEQDNADLAALQQRVRAVASELGELRSGGRAIGAYANAPSSTPLAQDTTG